MKANDMKRYVTVALALAGLSFAATAASAAKPDPARGQRVFNACAACHSLEPGRNMTGPSLANLWNRKAGSMAGFPRYSPALKSSGVVWNDATLDAWIKNPQGLVAGNDMTFQGIGNDQQRADLLAFLKEATQAGHAPKMGGMMRGGDIDLKTLSPDHRVQGLAYCGDTFRVTTTDGHTRAFWERNLRLKVDSSNAGPAKGVPVLVGAGMIGDRADVIFAAPEEISGFIKAECERNQDK
jgi:cytochrome c